MQHITSPAPYVPLLHDPRAGASTIHPLYGAPLGAGAALPIAGLVVGSAIGGAMSGTAFLVYQRTNSPVWAGVASGVGSLALGLVGLAIGRMAAA